MTKECKRLSSDCKKKVAQQSREGRLSEGNRRCPSKTKILAIGDIHGDTGLTKKLAEKAKKQNVDLVIFAGDFTFFGDTPKNLIKPFTKINKPVLLIHGNHEDFEVSDFLSKMYSNAENIHGYAFRKNDLGIFGAGGGDVIQVTPDKEIFKALKKGHKNIKDVKKKIMVTHMHHEGSKAEFSGWPGSKAVKKAIKEFKPDFLISAHIHEARGIEEKIGKTKIINVSRKEKVFEV